MSEEPPVEKPARTGGDVMSSLPHRRPHRRSAKRDAPAAAPTTPGGTKPKQARRPTAKRPRPAATPPPPPPPPPRDEVPPTPSSGPELLGTVLQAAGELAEIGIKLGAQVVRDAISRLPKP